MTKSEIIREIVLDWLDWGPNFSNFIEAFPDDEFEEYMDDDRVLQEMYRAALDQIRRVRDHVENVLFNPF